MNLRSRFWGIGAGLFAIVNLLGAGLAMAMGERVHTDVHLVLTLVGALVYLAWRTLTRGRRRDAAIAAAAAAADPQIEYLQQSIDALALEVERLGEAQRARERSRVEQIPPLPPKKDQP
jgi:threonine/homoserine/homoserine lactone efflux protein